MVQRVCSLLLFVLLIAGIASAQPPPVIYEKTCPSSYTPFPLLNTIDPSTNNYIANGCADIHQNLFWNGLLPSSGPSGSWGTITDANIFGVKADTHWVNNATFTSGSNMVTTPSGDRPFNCSTDIGKIMWGSNAQFGGNAMPSITTYIAKGTILAAGCSAHSIEVSNNSSSNCTPVGNDGCTFVWGAAGGVDDTANLNLAFAAAADACGTLLIPGGGFMMISSAITDNTSPCFFNTSGNSPSAGIRVMGMGPWGSGVVFTPDFNGATCPSGDGCLFSETVNGSAQANRTYEDFGMFGGTNAGSSLSSSNFALLVGFNSTISNVMAWDVWTGSRNPWCIQLGGAQNAQTSLTNSWILNCGQQVKVIQWANLTNNWIQGGSLSEVSVTAGPTFSSGNEIDFPNTQPAIALTGSGAQLYSSHDEIYCAGLTSLPCIGNASGSIFVLSGDYIEGGATSTGLIDCVSGSICYVNGGSYIYAFNDEGILNAGTLYIRDTQLYSSGTQVSNSGTVVDGGFTRNGGGTVSNTGIWTGEANSANNTAVASGNLVLSAGWGSTAAVTSLSGGDAPIQFTVTNSGTGQALNPTIAYTFPTPYPVAPFSCTATQTGGTNATGTFTSSSLSVTGVTFTFSLTPTASDTEIVQVTCVTP